MLCCFCCLQSHFFIFVLCDPETVSLILLKICSDYSSCSPIFTVHMPQVIFTSCFVARLFPCWHLNLLSCFPDLTITCFITEFSSDCKLPLLPLRERIVNVNLNNTTQDCSSAIMDKQGPVTTVGYILFFLLNQLVN